MVSTYSNQGIKMRSSDDSKYRRRVPGCKRVHRLNDNQVHRYFIRTTYCEKWPRSAEDWCDHILARRVLTLWCTLTNYWQTFFLCFLSRVYPLSPGLQVVSQGSQLQGLRLFFFHRVCPCKKRRFVNLENFGSHTGAGMAFPSHINRAHTHRSYRCHIPLLLMLTETPLRYIRMHYQAVTVSFPSYCTCQS